MSLLTTPSSSSVAAASTLAATAINTTPSGGGGATTPSSSGGGSGTPTNNNLPFEKDKIWYFTNEQLAASPSRRCGIKSDDELHYRQMTAYLIQEMGQRLQVSQLCINTAIVYMHRFYAFHSFTQFHRHSMASASLFLAAKVEEQPRKLEHVIRAANKCLPPTTEQNYADLAQELVFNENVLLQTLGFDVAIDHPHTHVVRTCQLVKACKDLAQTSYFLASNSLHLTSMCLQYRPTVVACFCIYLACKWSRWEIPQSTEGKHWFYYVDKSVSLELLKQLTDEFIAIYEKSPARLKSKLNSIKAIAQGAGSRGSAVTNSKDNKPKEEWKMSEMMKGYHSNITAPPELMNGNDSRELSAQQASALLPPPAIVPQQRRTGGGGGDHHQQRSSATGSTGGTPSSSSSHKLPNYAGSMPPDAHGDHKTKQQQAYNNRASSSHQSSTSSSSSSSSSSSAQRNSSSNSGGGGSGGMTSSSQRSSSSGAGGQQSRAPMPMDYHKSTRGMPPVGMPPLGGHKMPSNPKQQQLPPLMDGRSSSSVIPTKDLQKSSSSSSSNKMYPNAPPPPYGSSSSSSNSSSAPNNLMPRGGYISASGSTGSNGVPTNASYHTHRSSKSSTTATTTSSSSSSSVHNMPIFEQLSTALPYGQNAATSVGGVTQQQQHVPSYNSHMQQMQLDGQQPPLQSNPQMKNNSLFSPEWGETIKKEPTGHYNGLLAPHETLGYKLNNHTRDKDSPKKERLSSSSSGTPTKKDKHRQLPPASTSLSSLSSSSSLKSMLPPNKKPPADLLAGPPIELAGSSRDGSTGGGGGGGGLKRSNDLQYGGGGGLNKMDDDNTTMSREKMRKLDNSSGLPAYSGYGGTTSSSSSNNIDHDKHTPLSMSNGMETTPDLVRSLLKESLCTPNASLLKQETLTMPGLKPPAELFEPMPPVHIKKEPLTNTTLSSSSSLPPLGVGVGMDLDGLIKMGDIKSEGSIKSEKKKKKDKHKHKEKDKSKDKCDKEERKKHKKDKQKDRSKDMAGVINADSLKLVIKTNTAVSNPNGLVSSMHSTDAAGAVLAPPLKLKISKNKVEPSNYSMAPTGAQQLGATGLTAPMNPPIGSTNYPSAAAYAGFGMINASGGTNTVGGGGSGSGKKKDRDREREKEKKNKYNGANAIIPMSSSGYAQMAGAGVQPNLTTTMATSMANLSASNVLAPPPGLLMNTMAPSGAISSVNAPNALPVYTKK